MRRILTDIFTIPQFKWRFAIFIILTIVAEGLISQLWPLMDRQVTELVQAAINGQAVTWQDFRWPVAVLIVATLVYVLLYRVGQTLANVFREEVWNRIFVSGFAKLLYHDLNYLSQERSGALLNKVNRAANRLAELFTSSAAALFRNVMRALVALLIILSISWQISLMLVFTLVAYTAIYFWRFRKDIPYARELDEFSDREFTRVWEVVPQAMLTKIFTNEEREIEHVRMIGRKLKGITVKREGLWNLADAIAVIFVRFPTLFIKLFAAYQVMQGNYGLPTFFLIYSLISAVQEPMWVVNWFIWEIQDTYDRSLKYLKILESKTAIEDPPQPQPLRNARADIVFEKVSFDYPQGKKKVLDKIDLRFAGQTVTALVGKSGVGKTTITNLICRFYDPSSGVVKIGDQDLRQLKQQELRRQIGFVMQESFVFSGTVLDNMRYAKAEASEEEVIQALQKARAWDFIKDWPLALQTEIGERGVKLSGGQRQRLAIARTILKDPAILILDEATNALDSESELLVQQALQGFMHNRTVIVVAHRLSTIKNADLIYVLEKGKVKEAGTHRQLLAKNGVYKMLHDIQAGSFSKQKEILEEYELA